MLRSHQQALRLGVGAESVLKGLSDWVLPSLMSVALCLPSADPPFDRPVWFNPPIPSHVPVSSSHICCRSLKRESQLHGCCWMWKLRIMSVQYKRESWEMVTQRSVMTQHRVCAVSPSGGLILSSYGVAPTLKCQPCTACRHMCVIASSSV